MGEPQADDALREALAMGCDAAYLLSDEAFEDADVSVTTRILAAAIEKLGGADLVVAGRESGDTGAGQIGPRLAEALGYAQVTDVYALAGAEGEAPGHAALGRRLCHRRDRRCPPSSPSRRRPFRRATPTARAS